MGDWTFGCCNMLRIADSLSIDWLLKKSFAARSWLELQIVMQAYFVALISENGAARFVCFVGILTRIYEHRSARIVIHYW